MSRHRHVRTLDLDEEYEDAFPGAEDTSWMSSDEDRDEEKEIRLNNRTLTDFISLAISDNTQGNSIASSDDTIYMQESQENDATHIEHEEALCANYNQGSIISQENASKNCESNASLFGAGASQAGEAGYDAKLPNLSSKDEISKSKTLTKAPEPRMIEKSAINLVVIGHIDAGKSTLIGNLLVNLGHVPRSEFNKLNKDAKRKGKSSFEYAWVMDETDEERQRGITMDVAYYKFDTKCKSIVIIDSPGHRDFVGNMISGTAVADAALLVLDVMSKEFEDDEQRSGQTVECITLASSFGIRQLVVAINKMDCINWNEERFLSLKSRVLLCAETLGLRNTKFVPCSAITGENIVKRSPHSSWWEGTTLIDVLDELNPPERCIQEAFRLSVSDFLIHTNKTVKVSGKIISGHVAVKDKVVVMPSQKECSVKSILFQDQTFKNAAAGDYVDMILSGVDTSSICKGDVICHSRSPLKPCSAFLAKIVVFDVVSLPLTAGYSVILHCSNVQEPAVIEELISLIDGRSGKVIKKRPRYIVKNSHAVVKISVSKPVCIDTRLEGLSRFVLRSQGVSIASGNVTKLL